MKTIHPAKRFILLLICTGIAGSVSSGQDKENPKSWPFQERSRHYIILSDAPRKHARKLLQHMELVFWTYRRLLALPRDPTGKMTIVLYKDRKGYLRGGEPESSAAYYDGKFLVGYYHPEKMLNYFAHEGFHQFTDVAIKAIDKAPMWFTEGMADCIGNSVVRRNRLFMCAKDGLIARENLPLIRAEMEYGTFVPLKDLITMNRASFKSHSGPMYATSWSFCHFLLTYPKYEETKSQIPNGKYWHVLSRYIQLLSRDKVTSEEAWKASFVDRKGRALDVAVLEKEWKEYILKWPRPSANEKPSAKKTRGERKADDLLRKMEKKLTRAKTIQMKFDVVVEGTLPSHYQGASYFQKGNRYRLEATHVPTEKYQTRILVSDGKRMQSIRYPYREDSVKPTPAKYGQRALNGFMRAGIFVPHFDTQVDDPKMEAYGDRLFAFSKMTWKKREKVGKRCTQVLEGTLTVEEKYSYPTKIWIDSKTHLPLKRVLTLTFKDSKLTVTETYSDFVLNQDLDGSKFELPGK